MKTSTMMNVISRIITGLTHPILMLFYGELLLVYLNPYLFGGNTVGTALHNSAYFLIQVFLLSCIYPVFAIAMMKGLGLVDGYDMPTRQERIGPFIAVGISYLWLFVNLHYGVFRIFALGATISLWVAFVINLFSKISLHTTGMAGLLGMVIIMTKLGWATWTLIPILILAGLVGSLRLRDGAHDAQEVYGGYAVGLIGQFFAVQILGLPY